MIEKHKDHIRKLVKDGDWEALVQLLNQESKNQGKTDIDWSIVFGQKGSSDNKSVWKLVLESWLSAPKEQEHNFDWGSVVEKFQQMITSGQQGGGRPGTGGGHPGTSGGYTETHEIQFDENQKKILMLVIEKHGSEVKKLVNEGDWEGLIKLLTQTSKEQGTEVDWEKVLEPEKAKEGEKPNNGVTVIIFRTVLRDFADSKEESRFDIEQSLREASDRVTGIARNFHKGSDFVASIGRLANEHRDQLAHVIKSNDWNQLAQLLTKLSSESFTLRTIKWSSLISDENKDTRQRDSIRRIFTNWASDDSRKSNLDVRGMIR